MLVFILSVVRLITSEIACYLGNSVLIVVSSVYFFMLKNCVVLKGHL